MTQFDCEIYKNHGCKVFPQHPGHIRYFLSGVGFLPGILIFFTSGIGKKIEAAVAYEPIVYPIVIIVCLLLVAFFTYIIGRSKKVEIWDYILPGLAFGTTVIAFFVRITE